MTPCIVAAAFMLCLASYMKYDRATAGFSDALSILDECRILETKIRDLREKPTRAKQAISSQASLAKQVEEAAHSLGIESEQIVRISPSRPQRIRETDYLEQLTVVEVRNLQMEQLIKLMKLLQEHELSFTALRISMPRQVIDNDKEHWNAESTLRQLIFRPTLAER